MASRIGTILNILESWRRGGQEPLENVPEFWRRSVPDAPMNLLLRFETESGPRTVVAPRIPLKLASLIANTMIETGHYAEVIDHYPPVAMAERIKQIKQQKARPVRPISALSLV